MLFNNISDVILYFRIMIQGQFKVSWQMSFSDKCVGLIWNSLSRKFVLLILISFSFVSSSQFVVNKESFHLNLYIRWENRAHIVEEVQSIFSEYLRIRKYTINKQQQKKGHTDFFLALFSQIPINQCLITISFSS